jgi:hypothetical protein
MIYDGTLSYVKRNIDIFDKFYLENSSLYVKLSEKISSLPGVILRLVPELNFKKFNDFSSRIDDITEKITRHR